MFHALLIFLGKMIKYGIILPLHVIVTPSSYSDKKCVFVPVAALGKGGKRRLEEVLSAPPQERQVGLNWFLPPCGPPGASDPCHNYPVRLLESKIWVQFKDLCKHLASVTILRFSKFTVTSGAYLHLGTILCAGCARMVLTATCKFASDVRNWIRTTS